MSRTGTKQRPDASAAGPAGRERGLSILEMLIALALFGIVVVATGSAFFAPYRAWSIGRQFADEQHNRGLPWSG